jgi:hypothetical protein
MLISGELCSFWLDVKSFKNTLLELVSEYLEVGVHDELAPNTIENDAAAWPLLIFAVADYGAGRNFGRLPHSPPFPDVIVPVWTRQKAAILLGAVERAEVRQKHKGPLRVANEPIWAHAARLKVVLHLSRCILS